MSLQRYKICNLLSYQVHQVKKILDEDGVTVVQKTDRPHFHDIYVGLNETELDILRELGYSVSKYVAIGEGSDLSC